MRTLIDTNIAVLFVEGDRAIRKRVGALAEAPLLSTISRVELEAGIYLNGDEDPELRARVDALGELVEELPFTSVEVASYGQIIRHLGFSRRMIIDRMIAATAITANAVLATANPRDFRAVPGLNLEDWSK